VVVMVWMYYSSQIFLLGAEFTWVYAHRFGSLQGGADAERVSARPALAVKAAALPTTSRPAVVPTAARRPRTKRR